MHPYRIAGYVLGAFALLFGGFMLLGILLPGGWQAERTAEIGAPPAEVFSYLSGAARWSEWTPSLESGSVTFGPAEGPGSGRRWDDPTYGSGEFVITSSEPPNTLDYQVNVEEGAIQIQGRIELQPTAVGSRVTWREEGDFGWNPILGYMARRMDELQGAQLEASLASLRERAEGSVRSLPPE
jgi:uncharacterized protein YndB with AHSA1/START domain